MLPAPYAKLFRDEGFQQIGELRYRLNLTAWWHSAPGKLLQLVVLSVGRSAILRGDKSYYMKSVSAEGETWARDIGGLHDYLEGHFPEARVSFSHFRDVPPALARRELQRRIEVEAPTQRFPTVAQVAQLQRELEAKQRGMQSMEAIRSLMAEESDLLTGHMHQQARNDKAAIGHLQDQLQRERQRFGVLEHIQREYQRKGSAAVFAFNISSNLQVARDAGEVQAALRAIVAELTDMHRYQIMQKLGGRLNIQTAEAEEPAMSWIEQWFGGALTPTQLGRLGPEFDRVRMCADEHTMVTPDAPIVVDDRIRHAEKHMAARFLSDVLHRMDKTDFAAQKAALSPEAVPSDAMPLALGHRVDQAGKVLESVVFPLTQMVHMYMSGTTGGGKSYLARVLIEEASQHKQLAILVLDPRNQSVGLLVPEDRPKILQRYEEFGMKIERAHGFAFDYFAPGLPYAPALPDNLSSLARARTVVSFKGLDDGKRCALAGRILDAVFATCSAQESERPRLLILVDEAQLFTRKRLVDSAKESAAHAERALDRIAREGRKFGIVLALVSQTMKDFGYELASIRQMTTTKIFLRNSDREIEYATDIIGDGRLLVQLPTATALVHNANWGIVRLGVRPPYSKVFELGEAEIRQLFGNDFQPRKILTADAKALLGAIERYGASPERPLNMSRAADLAGITSKRKLVQLVDELEKAQVIRTKRLFERGQPRVIALISHSPSRGNSWEGHSS